MPKVTISQLAEASGVSTATVSRVFSGNGQIAPETAEKVRAAAIRLGYYPNPAAQALAAGQNQKAGHCIRIFSRGGQSDGFFFDEIEKGLMRELGEQNCFAKISYAGPWGRDYSETQAVDDCLGYAGVILLGNAWSGVVERCTRAGIPLAVVCDDQGYSDLDFFEQDNRDGARQAVRHLVELGHKRIGIAGMPAARSSDRERFQGYEQALGDCGLVPDKQLLVECESDLDCARQTIRARLPDLARAECSALFCTNDLIALGGLKACQEAGWSVPGKLSLVGFDNCILSAHATPALTTVGSDKGALGREVARRLLARLVEPDLPALKFLLPTKLIVRASTGPLAGQCESV